jgi:hypothetical protein
MDSKDEARVKSIRDYLGPDGIEFFRRLKMARGKVDPLVSERELSIILGLPAPSPGVGRIPHPVHFREGMSVRNHLRASGLCKDWTAHDFDNRWAELVERAIEEPKPTLGTGNRPWAQ